MRAGLLVLTAIAAVSVLTGPRENAAAGAPLLVGAEVPSTVRATIERSCADCHSERTRYPWYSYVAPVSLLIRRDVTGGRGHLNFSRWNEYTAVRRMRLLSEIANQVKEREMPMGIYLLIHRGARLTDAEVRAVFDWTQAERMRMIDDPRP